MSNRGLILVALAAILILLALGPREPTITISPNIPPLPKGGVYVTYFDDLTLKINDKTVLTERFTNTTNNFKMNNLSTIIKEIYNSQTGSLALRQELDNYWATGNATCERFFEFEPNSVMNMTIWCMVPKSNTDVYVGGHGTEINIVMGGDLPYSGGVFRFNASIDMNLDWHSLDNPSSGLGLITRVHYGSAGEIEMNRTDNGGFTRFYSFGVWHRLNMVVDSGWIRVYMDGVLVQVGQIPFGSLRRIHSLELVISLHAFC